MSALDMARDPRWGRSEECYSEDPCLAASMAKAAVTGMQSTGVGSVAKHFCAQGETTGGVNASAARIGERELREIHFPSAKACCEQAWKAHGGINEDRRRVLPQKRMAASAMFCAVKWA